MRKLSRSKIAQFTSVVAVALFVTGLVFVQTGLALGTNYYVRPGGNDAQCDGLTDADYSDGVTACAKQTIQAAIDAAS
ncbi:MAG: hypothetical protein JW862_17895, partial [Anaerolineales bacterium]|nr:hypothetical protein [Anaerolineales bacterium]